MTTPAQTLDRPCRTVEQVAIARLRRVLRELVDASREADARLALSRLLADNALRDTEHLEGGE